MRSAPEQWSGLFDHAFERIRRTRESFEPKLSPREVGLVTEVSAGIAKVRGLPGVAFGELLQFPGELPGIAFNLDELEIGVVLLGDHSQLNTGDEVLRTGRVADVPVGEALLGRVIYPLGQPLDNKGPIKWTHRLPINRPAPEILDRAPVTTPLQTGIKVIDAIVPIGRGQRELILGDRQTGKTTIAIDTIINQRDQGVICVYCAIGQRASSVAKVVSTLRSTGAMNYTVVLVSEGNDPPGLIYIAPYAATSIAEYFMEKGKDVLIVYDDLNHHAWAYREISLLLRRPPGREAFPGDIFYIHSRLLERATHLCPELGGGSLTALPIVATEEQNISAYIPTNLISITDGQIYLSPRLFQFGMLPAVDIGKSVSRVGGKAQYPVYRAVTRDLKLAYLQFEELEAFARFGTQMDVRSREIIHHGHRIRACFRQAQNEPFPLAEQIGVLLALMEHLFAAVPLEYFSQAEHAVRKTMRELPGDQLEAVLAFRKMDDALRQQVLSKLSHSVYPYQKEDPNEQHAS